MGYGRWEMTWLGTMLTAVLIELLNAFYLKLWSYNLVWSALAFLPFSNFGMFGFIGWTVLWISTLSITYNLSKKFFIHSFLIWILAWFLNGFIAETINAKLAVGMWIHYGITALYPMPILDFSPIALVGWVAIGAISWVIIFVLNKLYS